MFVILYFAWALWLGSIVFFSFVVAPTVHGVLDRADASRLMASMFPRYYLFSIVCGAVALAAALTTANDLRLTIPMLTALVMAAYARQVLTPAMAGARETKSDDDFARMHVLSVRLNIVALAALILAGTFLAIL